MTANMSTAVICVSMLGLLLFVLGFFVSIARGRTQALSGTSDDPASFLARIIRAHGNTAEYAPMFAVLFLYLGSSSPAPWVVWTIIAATIFRYLIVAGLLTATMDKANPLRFLGALGTYITGALLSVAALLTVV